MARFDFAVANNLDFQKTMSDARLSFHIRRVFHTINTVVSCLDDSEFVARQLEHVGAIHAEYGLKGVHLIVSLYSIIGRFFLSWLESRRFTLSNVSKTTY